MIENINKNKIRLLLKSCWIMLFVYWLFVIITNNYINMICTNIQFIKITNYIENNFILNIIVSFLMYYANWLFIVYSILREKLTYKWYIISPIIIILFAIKFIFQNIQIINFIDYLMIIPLMFILKKKWYRAIIGVSVALILSLISSAIKNVFILKVNPNELDLVLTCIYSIDIYIMCGIYYLHELLRKENEHGIQTSIFQKCKSLENCFSSFSKRISNTFNFVSSKSNLSKKDIFFYYCSFIFFIITYCSIIIIASFFGKVIEATISIIFFHIFRKTDKKTFHAESSDFECWLTSVISFSIVSILELDLKNSLLSCICMAYLLSTVMYYIKDYLEYRITKNNLSLINEETLDGLCVKYNLSDIARKRLKLRYIDKLKMKEIAQIECVEQDSIEEYFRTLKKRLK